jgi:peroxiredoxin
MIKFMADPAGEFTHALGMGLNDSDATAAAQGLYNRCKRHALYVVNGRILAVLVSESPDDPQGETNPSLTLASTMLIAIQATK